MKNQIKKLLAFALSCVTLLGICACAPEGETDGPISDVGNGAVAPKVEIENPVEDGDVLAMPTSMAFLSTSLASEDTTSISVTLTATVEPVDTYNKQVDWSASWKEGASLAGEDVSNYLTVVSTTDGGLTATVTCHQAFVDDIIVVTVTTRDGGFTDSCDVNFIGVPTKMTLETDMKLSSWTNNRGSTINYYSLGTNATFTMNIVLSNDIGMVSERYYEAFVLTETNGAEVGYKNGTFDEFGNEQKTYKYLYDIASSLYSANVSGGTLTVQTFGIAVSSDYFVLGGNTYSFTRAEDFYGCKLQISLPDYGLFKTINFCIGPSVNAVALSNKEITM